MCPPSEIASEARKAAVAAFSTVRKTRTLYVREEDQIIWDKAREVIGDSLSTYLTNHLREVVARTEAAKQGYTRIVLSFRERGVIFRTKAFHGRWLISPERPWMSESNPFSPDGDPLWSVAITAKDNVVFFKHYGSQDENPLSFAWGELFVFGSFEEAACDRAIPNGVIGDAMESRGVEIEEMDI